VVVVASMGVFALAMVHGLVEVGFAKTTVAGVFVGDDNCIIGNVTANGIRNALERGDMECPEFAVALQSAPYDSCQSACNSDPLSAPKNDPLILRRGSWPDAA